MAIGVPIDEQFIFTVKRDGTVLAVIEWTNDFLVHSTYENLLRL